VTAVIAKEEPVTEPLNTMLLVHLNPYDDLVARAHDLRAREKQLSQQDEALRAEYESMRADPQGYRHRDRSDLQAALERNHQELAACEARPPRLFGKSEYQTRLALLRDEIARCENSLAVIAREGPARLGTLPALIEDSGRALAEVREALRSADVEVARRDTGMELVRTDGFKQIFRHALLELAVLAARDDQEAYAKQPGILESGLALMTRHADPENARRCEVAYLFVQIVVFTRWYRPADSEPYKRFTEVAKSFGDEPTGDCLLELAIALGQKAELEIMVINGRRQGFADELIFLAIDKRLASTEQRLLGVLETADQEAWKMVAQQHLERIARLRQG
jgi:hypothetical protein